jgi:flavin-dependent dehydrogenase
MTMNSSDDIRPRYDAIVVGARCAGAATAMLLAQRGLRVLAVDRGSYGGDTLSTHALMRGAVLQLHRWGVLSRVVAAATPPVRSTTFHYGDEPLAVAIKPRAGVDALYAPRRALLDRLLVDAAVGAGATVKHGIQLRDVVRSSAGRVAGAVLVDGARVVRTVAADLVIGADGLRSTVAPLVGARDTATARHATGVVYGYWEGLDVSGYQWYFRPGLSAGAIPTNEGRTCVFVAVPSTRFTQEFGGHVTDGYHRVLSAVAPRLAGQLSTACLVDHLHGFAGSPGYMRRPWGPGWALVGDAGYFKDPLTAHGITDALRDAELLADAVADGASALADYESARDELARPLFDVTDRIASFEWDLDEIRSLHEALVREMARETKAIAAADRVAGAVG